MFQHYALTLNYGAQTHPAICTQLRYSSTLMFQQYEQLIVFSSLTLNHIQLFCYQLPYGSTLIVQQYVQLIVFC